MAPRLIVRAQHAERLGEVDTGTVGCVVVEHDLDGRLTREGENAAGALHAGHFGGDGGDVQAQCGTGDLIGVGAEFADDKYAGDAHCVRQLLDRDQPCLQGHLAGGKCVTNDGLETLGLAYGIWAVRRVSNADLQRAAGAGFDEAQRSRYDLAVALGELSAAGLRYQGEEANGGRTGQTAK